jgi:WD40 repeat protein
LDPPTAKEKSRIDGLTRLLDDDAYEKREKAGEELLSMGLVAEPTLRRLATESASVEVRIRCRRLRDKVFTASRVTLSGHKERVSWLAFSADGRQLISCSSQDGTVRVWDANAGRETTRFTVDDLTAR